MMVRRGFAPMCMLLAGLGGAALPALAADLTVPPPPPVFVPPPLPVNTKPFGVLDEARFGLLAHGVYTAEFGSVGVNGELLSVRPYSFGENSIWTYFVPKFHLGGDLDTGGKTSDIYGGLTWQFPLYQRLFGELTFGGSGNDGKAGAIVPAGYSRVGCNVLFRESAALGYHLTEHWNVQVIAEHMSNAGACVHNEGMTNIGARLGYVF